jgi:PPOX class probable F420-dependent enzyme
MGAGPPQAATRSKATASRESIFILKTRPRRGTRQTGITRAGYTGARACLKLARKRMEHELMRSRLAAARVGRLATVEGSGTPHVVPVCYVLDGDIVYWAVDQKPKSTRRLTRLENIRQNPRVELIADNYAEDWTQLWWVRIKAHASILAEAPEAGRALDLLAAKYPQYGRQRPDGPVVRLAVRRWSGWSATAGA